MVLAQTGPCLTCVTQPHPEPSPMKTPCFTDRCVNTGGALKSTEIQSKPDTWSIFAAPGMGTDWLVGHKLAAGFGFVRPKVQE